MIKKLLFAFSLIFLISIGFVYYVKSQHFPFVSLSYTQSIHEFNSIPQPDYTVFNSYLSYKIPIDENVKKIVEQQTDIKEEEKNNVSAVIKKLNRFVRKKMFAQYNVITDFTEVLNSVKPVPGICSEYSKFLCASAQALGFPSRVVWLWGHSISEIYFDNYGWVLVDTNWNTIIKDKSGRYLSVIDAVDNFENIIPEEIEEFLLTDDPVFKSDAYRKVLPDNPILVVIEGDKLFSFEQIMRSPVEIIKYIFGKDLVKGIQYTKNRNKFGNLRFVFQIYLLLNIIIFSYIIFMIIRQKKNIRNKR